MGSWYLVRHGETDWNRSGRIQGHTDVPLNNNGRREIGLLAERLAPCSFAAVYSSDLSRTSESAEIIVSGREVSIVADPDLREFSYGEWEGMTSPEVEAQFPNAYAQLMGAEDNSFVAPGGESSAQVLDRVHRFCARVEEQFSADADILVVAHGGTIRALLACLLYLPNDSLWKFEVGGASLSVVSNHARGRVLDLWNDTSHLMAAGLPVAIKTAGHG